MRTPEGELKAKIKKHLDSLGAYWYMPVPFGYGKPTLDFLCCVNGRFLAIETKAPGKKPTRRQELTIEQIRHAGGIAFWCDSFEVYLTEINQCPHCKKIFTDGDTCTYGGCPMGGDF